MLMNYIILYLSFLVVETLISILILSVFNIFTYYDNLSYYLYNNIPKFVVQMSPILFIVKNSESRVLPNYIFNVIPNIDETNNSSTIVWKTIYTKIA
jgi:hypothetical protein